MSYTSQLNETDLLPSTVDLVVTWLRSRPAISSLVGTRVSTSRPVRDSDFITPWLTVKRITGLPLLREGAIDTARLQFDAWGGVKANGAPDWEPADLLIRTVEREVRITTKAKIDGKGHIMGTGLLQGIQQLEDPDDGSARFWMDAVFIARGGE